MGADGDFPVSYLQLLQRQFEQFGRVGATRIIVSPDLSAPVPPLSDVQSRGIDFLDDGIVLALYGQTELATPASMATTETDVRVGGTESLFSDGSSPAFCPFFMLFGTNQNWFPITRRTTRGQHWSITYRNKSAALATTPKLAFSFIAAADVSRQIASMPREWARANGG